MTPEQLAIALEGEQRPWLPERKEAAALIRSLAAENAALRKARDSYEQALLAAFPFGSKGEVFESWNAARAAMKDKP
jgi:hypothetical protein